MLTKSNKEFILAYHYEGEFTFEICAKINFTYKSLQSFFPIIYAKSGSNNPLRFDINSMVFNTYEKNSQIMEFATQFDHNMENLFKDISLLAKNQKEIKEKKRKAEKLNIEYTYRKEKQIEKYLKNSKQQILNTLSETDMIIGFFDIHSNSKKNYSKTVLTGTQEWLDQSVGKLKEMEQFVGQQNAEVNPEELDEIFKDTDQLMNKIKSIMSGQEQTFAALKEFHSVIKDNISILRERKKNDKLMDRKFKKFAKKHKNTNISQLNDTLSILLAILGTFIVLVLLLILCRVSYM